MIPILVETECYLVMYVLCAWCLGNVVVGAEGPRHWRCLSQSRRLRVWSRLYQYLDIRERGYVSSFNVVQACNGSRNRSNPRQRALSHVVGLHGHWVSRRRRVGLHFCTCIHSDSLF